MLLLTRLKLAAYLFLLPRTAISALSSPGIGGMPCPAIITMALAAGRWVKTLGGTRWVLSFETSEPGMVKRWYSRRGVLGPREWLCHRISGSGYWSSLDQVLVSDPIPGLDRRSLLRTTFDRLFEWLRGVPARR